VDANTPTAGLEALHSLKNSQEIEARLTPLLKEVGVEWWLWGMLTPDSYSLPRAHMMSNFPLTWGLEYKLVGFSKIDYVLKNINDRVLPLVWNAQDTNNKNTIKFHPLHSIRFRGIQGREPSSRKQTNEATFNGEI